MMITRYGHVELRFPTTEEEALPPPRKTLLTETQKLLLQVASFVIVFAFWAAVMVMVLS